ncbi:hypothetical protein M9Y10_015798 [Tritrichomonas musculus]|uniref:BTB domain-containing protein n=1 Tax=Tritrichomonas musculus TaxID=1915356 RepID=A0ABR2I4N2_9EUKA
MDPFSNHSEIEFIVDNSHYFVPLSLVKPFSSTIQQLDPTEKYLVYQFYELNDPQGMFELVIDLFYGRSIDINQNNAFFLGYIGDILGITQLSEATNSYRRIQLTPENIFDILSYLGAFHISEKNIIKYAGDNWPLLSKSEKALYLPFYILNEIFSKNPQISVDFDFISDLLQKKSMFESPQRKNEFISLFEYCDFSLLTSRQMKELFDYVSYDTVPPQILKKFTQRLTKDVKNEQTENSNRPIELSKKPEQTLSKPPAPPQSPSKGSEQTVSKIPTPPTSQPKNLSSSSATIIKSPQPPMTSLHQTNSMPIPTGETATPTGGIRGCRRNKPAPVPPLKSSQSVIVDFESGYELSGVITMLQDNLSQWKKEVDLIIPKNMKGESFKYSLFDHNPQRWWSNYDGKKCSIDTAWIIVGFHHYTLRLDYYTLASRGEKSFYSQPMSWKIYGSNDPAKFEEKDLIVYVKNAPSMNVPRPMKTFQVERRSKSYSYFKFVLLKNFTTRVQDQGELSLSAFELFGVLTAK